MATRPHYPLDGIDIVVTISHITPPLIEELANFLNARGFSVETSLRHKESLRPHAHHVGHAKISAARSVAARGI